MAYLSGRDIKVVEEGVIRLKSDNSECRSKSAGVVTHRCNQQHVPGKESKAYDVEYLLHAVEFGPILVVNTKPAFLGHSIHCLDVEPSEWGCRILKCEIGQRRFSDVNDLLHVSDWTPSHSSRSLGP